MGSRVQRNWHRPKPLAPRSADNCQTSRLIPSRPHPHSSFPTLLALPLSLRGNPGLSFSPSPFTSPLPLHLFGHNIRKAFEDRNLTKLSIWGRSPVRSQHILAKFPISITSLPAAHVARGPLQRTVQTPKTAHRRPAIQGSSLGWTTKPENRQADFNSILPH